MVVFVVLLVAPNTKHFEQVRSYELQFPLARKHDKHPLKSSFSNCVCPLNAVFHRSLRGCLLKATTIFQHLSSASRAGESGRKYRWFVIVLSTHIARMRAHMSTPNRSTNDKSIPVNVDTVCNAHFDECVFSVAYRHRRN